MNKIKALYIKLEKILSSAKFAVVIISIFTLALVFGTFMESFHGADYASRLVYKSWWFILLEILMFLSIVMAVVVRLPLKKRLYGFYTIHSGLVILFIGSLFTYINGVDGSIQIIPNTPANKILIDRDYIRITFKNIQKVYKLALPYSAGPRNITNEINGLKLVKYLPFAQNELVWQNRESDIAQLQSGHYQIFNENMSQEFTLSLDPNSDFKSTMNMGLLAIHYMPLSLEQCMSKESKTNLIIWNLQTSECFTPEDKNIKIEQTPQKSRFLILEHESKIYKFFPDFSPVALKDDLTKDPNSPFRILSRSVFEEKPNLFIFGESMAFYKKRKKKWILKSLKEGPVKTPWMNFQIRLLRHETAKYPVEIPSYVKPVMDNNQIVKGGTKALKVRFNEQDFWVRNDAPLEISNGKDSIRLEIVPEHKVLPYQITLDRFVMNKNPGTNNPASYESYVHLLDGRTTQGVQKHHIYMNNPLKYDEFTFYQSSYFPIGPNEQYGSVLSVNYDPGRFFKYLGSLFIVLGSAWHYVLNRRRKKKVQNNA